MQIVLAIAGAFAGLAVILGAFAAHGLKGQMPENLLNAFQTGVQYQFLHSLALIMIVILAKQFPSTLWNWSVYLMITGIIMFSGSLYLLALTGQKWLGPITPLGGVCFILAWGVFVFAAIKSTVE